jgi:hypothetical protein
MQVWWETPNAGYMMRQHFAANLYERLSTRPFLTPLEKVRDMSGDSKQQQTRPLQTRRVFAAVLVTGCKVLGQGTLRRVQRVVGVLHWTFMRKPDTAHPGASAVCGFVQRWITYQLLHALSQAHAHGVCHGDIKCENVMVTSWNWLFLTDFASYKPTYLPADNPVSFSRL